MIVLLNDLAYPIKLCIYTYIWLDEALEILFHSGMHVDADKVMIHANVVEMWGNRVSVGI